MNHYDPAVAPPSSHWVSLDEQERIVLVEEYHRRARIELPEARLHAAIHTIVENQLAEAVPEVVVAFERLQREGLDRHEAIHAVGSVLTEHVYEALKAPDSGGDLNAAYLAGLETLSAASWHAA